MQKVNLQSKIFIYFLYIFYIFFIYFFNINKMKAKNLNTMLNKKRKKILNQIYVKHFIEIAGNDNPKIKKEKEKLIKQLESLALQDK